MRRGGNRFVCLSDPSIGHVARGAGRRAKGAAARAPGATPGDDVPPQQQRQRLLQRAPGTARRRLQRRRGAKVGPQTPRLGLRSHPLPLRSRVTSAPRPRRLPPRCYCM